MNIVIKSSSENEDETKLLKEICHRIMKYDEFLSLNKLASYFSLI
jgi:hypothetical protein